MTTKVQTGGLTEIRYGKGHKIERDPELEADIEKGYAEADERKRKERMVRWIIIIGVLVVLGIVGVWWGRE